MVDAKGRKIFDGRYEIVSIVGRGACSVVYHARHAMAPATEVALKVLNKKGQTQAVTGDKLRKEALAMVSCRHRFVVRLDDFHTVGELSYLSMEYAVHSDLRKYAATMGGKLTPKLGELFLLQSAEALGFVHKAGVIHRDIKPDNLLAISEKECRLADFGVAVLPGEESSLDDLRQGVGTMAYMAPEVLEGRSYDQRSDVYSLGVTFYELMTGRHPFEGASLADQVEIRRDGAFAAPHDINPEIPTYISSAIMQALSFDPARRFPTGKELQQTILVNRAQMRLEPEDEAPRRTVEPKRAAPPPPTERPTTRGMGTAAVTPDQPPPVAPQRIQSPPPPTNVGAVASLDMEPPRMAANASAVPMPEPVRAQPAPMLTPTAKPGLAALALSGTDEHEESSRNRVIPPGSAEVRPVQDLLGHKSSKRGELDPKGREKMKEKMGKAPPKKPVEAQKPKQTKTSSFSQKDPKKSFYMTLSISVFLGILLYGNIFLKKHYNIDITKKIIEMSFGGENESAPFIPQYAAQGLAFPAMPPGVYAGTTTGIVPGTSIPLSIISFSEQGFMVFLPGIEGWSPTMVALESDPKAEASTVRITSNGFILELSGQVVEGEIVGYIKNVISGDQGEWRVRPVSK